MKKGHFLCHSQERRVIPLAIPNGEELFPWSCPRDERHSFYRAHGRWVVPFVDPKR